MYYPVTKIQNDRKDAEINTINKEVIKTPIFKALLKITDKIELINHLKMANRDKHSLRINRDKINDPSIKYCLSQTLPLQYHPKHLEYLYKFKLKECKFLRQQQGHNLTQIRHHTRNCHLLYFIRHTQTSPWTLANLDHVTRYSNNSHGIFQSEVIFEELKVTKLKKDLLDDLGVKIKGIIKKSRILARYKRTYDYTIS